MGICEQTIDMDSAVVLEQILSKAHELGASDIHLSDRCFPTFRLSGELHAQNDLLLLDMKKLEGFVSHVLERQQQLEFKTKKSVDIAFTSEAGLRYRVNIYTERACPAFAIRRLDSSFRTLAELRLPSQLTKLAQLKDGLVLVTGATGSGKSTTLASVVNEINQTRACHILTIEDPVEFLHHNQKAMVHQRELGRDVDSFSDAIRSAMREDPDVILLGEMRDLATMSAAITAAETGHLVFSTLHTNDAIGVIDRLVGSFPGEQQAGVRQQLSMVLRAVVTQTLVRPDNGVGRVPVNEILIINTAVANLIRTHKPEQIYSFMESGKAIGNQTFDYALALKVKEKLLPREQAQGLARKPSVFDALVNQVLRER